MVLAWFYQLANRLIPPTCPQPSTFRRLLGSFRKASISSITDSIGMISPPLSLQMLARSKVPRLSSDGEGVERPQGYGMKSVLLWRTPQWSNQYCDRVWKHFRRSLSVWQLLGQPNLGISCAMKVGPCQNRDARRRLEWNWQNRPSEMESCPP